MYRRAEVISWATSNQCNEITGPSELLTWVLTPVEWAAFPPNRTLNAAGVLVIAVVFDILTPIAWGPANNANNAVVKIWQMSKNNRASIVQALQILKTRQIYTMPDCDISEMSDVMFGMTSVTNAEIFAHLRAAYSELDQNDYSIIYSRLQSAKFTYWRLQDFGRDSPWSTCSPGILWAIPPNWHNKLFHESARQITLDMKHAASFFAPTLKWQLAPSSLWWPQYFCMHQPLYQLHLHLDIPTLRPQPLLSPLLLYLSHQRLKLH